MNTNLSNLKRLRVYQRFTVFELFNLVLCNRIVKSQFVVSNALGLYRMATYFPGRWVANKFVASTFGKMFTGGQTLEALRTTSTYFSRRNIPLIVNYCVEGEVGNPKGTLVLDENAKGFADSVRFAANQPNHTASIKISALIKMDLLQKYNRSIVLLDKLWRESSQEGILQPEKLFESLQNIYRGLTEEDFAEYLRIIHNYQGPPSEVPDLILKCRIDAVDFKSNHHPFYLYDSHKNDLVVSKLLFPLQEKQKVEMQAFIRRLGSILDIEFDNPNNLRIIGDAEQSYLQKAIESIFYQLQERYNTHKVYIVHTLQNYLQRAPQRLQFQLQAAKRKQLFFGIKLVRGAYLIEERELARTNNVESPIQGSFDKTTDNYLRNFQAILDSGVSGEIFLAGHNTDTIKALLKLKQQSKGNLVINFTQLYGLGDHLTMLLKEEGERVYKLLSWGPTEVMIPFMIRRGEELTHSKIPLGVQYSLLMSELRLRVLGF